MKLHELREEKQVPPEGMFEKGSSQAIVGWIRDNSDDEADAIATLNFWIMKQGKDLEPHRKAALEFAKELLAKEFKHEKED